MSLSVTVQTQEVAILSLSHRFIPKIFNHAPRPLSSNCFARYENIRMDISTTAVVLNNRL